MEPDAPATTEATRILGTTLLDLWQDFVARTPYLLAALVVLFLTGLGAWLARRFIGRVIIRRRLRPSLRELILRLVAVGAWLVGLLVAAIIVFPGLTPTRALGGLGILSVAVGFAFKDIFENFFAGVLILWRFPFESGDFIQCEGILGRVEDVTVRMTLIRKVTGELVVVPNGFLFNNPVEVLTNLPRRRATIMAGVAYGERLEAAIPVIREAVRRCTTVAPDHPVEIFAHGFGESSMDIEVAWWTDPTPLGFRRSTDEVVVAIKRALDDAGIEIPFPYRTLTFKEPLVTSISLPSPPSAGRGGPRGG